MKRVLACVLLCLTLFALTACGGGDVGEVGIKEVVSTLYTSAEIESGVNAVLDFFKENFAGCTLRELEYIGDDNLEPYQEYAQLVGADSVMTFVGVFDVDGSEASPSLEPNSTYKNYTFTVACAASGKWEVVSNGYA